jgi:hypothetical protein
MTNVVAVRRYVMVAMLTVLGAALLLSMSAQKAAASNFCTNVWLSPYGQGGDRCWGPSAQGLNFASVSTFTRAGCVSIADGSNNLLTSWVCGAAGSAPGYAAAAYYNSNYLQYRKAVIRNNNTSNGGQFSGGYNCFNPC